MYGGAIGARVTCWLRRRSLRVPGWRRTSGCGPGVRGVGQVHERCGDVGFFDRGVNILGAATADAVDEVGIVVAGGFPVGPGSTSSLAKFVGVVTVDGQASRWNLREVATVLVFWRLSGPGIVVGLRAFFVASAVSPAGGRCCFRMHQCRFRLRVGIQWRTSSSIILRLPLEDSKMNVHFSVFGVSWSSSNMKCRRRLKLVVGILRLIRHGRCRFRGWLDCDFAVAGKIPDPVQL